MKKFIYFFLLMLMMPLIISSCKKDNNDEPSSISEKWLFEKIVEQDYNSAGVVVSTVTDSDWTVNDYLLLHTDGTMELSLDNEKITGTYKIEKSVMTLILKDSNTILTTIIATVVEKTSSKFTFYSDETVQGVKVRSTVYLKK